MWKRLCAHLPTLISVESASTSTGLRSGSVLSVQSFYRRSHTLCTELEKSVETCQQGEELLQKRFNIQKKYSLFSRNNGIASAASCIRGPMPYLQHVNMLPNFQRRFVVTMGNSDESDSQDAAASASIISPRIKFKRLDKTARHIMQILNKEAVQHVRNEREVPDIRPGYIVQLKVEVPENKRRVSTIKGIVIARRNAGLNTTFRIRRLVAGVGVESLFLLYSPNIKEIKVLDKKKVRRAKLYYLRDRMNPLKK